ncbi:MAG: response regulator [Melioribacteraceae bacterium]
MGKTKILVVEDEIIIAMEIADRLSSMGYEVLRIVANGEMAINVVMQDKPDLILMDIMIQGDMDGIQTATKIRGFSDVPVIYLTANADEGTLQRAKVSDAFGYLIKPFEEKELNTTIEMALYKHKMEAQLRANEAQFRGLFENSSIGIYRMDLEGNIILANPELLKILGCTTLEDLSNKKAYECMTGGVIDMRKIFEILQKNGKLKNHNLEILRKDGSKIPVSLSGTIVKDKDGIRRLDGTIEDISMQIKYQQGLIKAKEKAEESDKLKSEFLAGMSHEIRTPINTIMSYVSLLEDELKGKKSDFDEIFHAIELGSLRITRTVDSILNMAQFQAGTFEVFKTKIDLETEILKNLRDEFKNSAIQRGLELRFINDTEKTNLLGDKYSLTQLFVNLVDNALKYTKEGFVEVRTYNDEDGILSVDVKDSGIGISEEFLPTLFKSFTQEEQGYSRKFDGNGLGLALVKGYCKLNDAFIKVSSKKNIGTTFTVKFTQTNQNNAYKNVEEEVKKENI